MSAGTGAAEAARPTLSLVVPAYNEQERLPAFLAVVGNGASRELAGAGLELVEVLVVDDGSSDATLRLLKEAAPRIRVIAAEHTGKGGAVARGVAEARGEYVLISDLDLATPLSEAAPLFERLRAGADLALGSRKAPGADVVGVTRLRRLAGRGFARAAALLAGTGVQDTQCGFKLMRTELARTLTTGLAVRGFAYDVELLLRARRAGLRVEEVPVRWVHGAGSRVKLLRVAPGMLADLLRLARLYRGRRGAGVPAAARAEGLPSDGA